MLKHFLLAAAVSASLGAVGAHRTSSQDTQAIERLLTTYTTSVTNQDQAAFEALLLDANIPFASTSELQAQQTMDTHRYPRFRKSVFESGNRYSQQFSNIHIEQDGDLAQVSLDFLTKNLTTGDVGFGWKTLQLLKARGQWKIASELYTIRDAAERSGT